MRVRLATSIMLAALLTGLTLALAGGALAQTQEPSAPAAPEAPGETPPSPSPASPEARAAAVLDPSTVQAVMGRDIRSVADENMGRVVDVIVDRTGQVCAAVIDFGGFLGVGSRKIAVEWSMLRFGSGEKADRVIVDLTKAQVKAAPEYKPGKPIVVLSTATAPPRANSGPSAGQQPTSK